MDRERAWAAFDERVKMVERAYVERHRQRAADLVRRCGEEPSEEYLAGIVEEAFASGAFRSKAWQVALVLYGKPARHNVEKVIDLREAIHSTGSPVRQLPERRQQRVDVVDGRVAHEAGPDRATSVA